MRAAFQWALLALVAVMLVVGLVRAWDMERPYARPDVDARIKALGVR